MEQTDTVTVQDLDLVHRAQAGDKNAFEALYRAHVGRVYAICLRMVANQTRATELTQDTFVRVWQTLGSFRGASAFSSWLYRVTVNTVLGEVRSKRRRITRIQSTDDLSSFDTPVPGPAPDSAMDLEQAIAALPPKARNVLILHELEGYRHEEIADMMGIAPGTSKAHLHRARRLLKKILNR
ncbi:MAG: RNA polymerase sigma factor [Rhodothermales bacterium]